MKTKISLALAAATVLLPLGLRSQTPAQTPAMVVVPAEVADPSASAALPVRDNAAASASVLKFLQETKAANDATLKTQAAQLATLDDLQKAAEEIKIYSKRT
jgi:hypothetical protein